MMDKFTIDNAKDAPENLRKIVYDKDDNVLFGSKMVKGKVKYTYVPAEHMESGVDFIIGVGVDYDGVGNKGLPKDAEKMHFENLYKRFTNNEF